ncbi:retinoblastoma-associated protein [Platysternon megacephalum]|uniref:Retinoblastoma-associated protein n=1 Tax=Platysternon megacephalum TaxID=55544 RepID=A0A4D9ER74_9SAUR|nr:retinoblastoma-associated protein [Platysternon megacephalum]
MFMSLGLKGLNSSRVRPLLPWLRANPGPASAKTELVGSRGATAKPLQLSQPFDSFRNRSDFSVLRQAPSASLGCFRAQALKFRLLSGVGPSPFGSG